MKGHNKLALLFVMLIFSCVAALALSADEAIAIATVQNNFLSSGETASVAKEMISYNGDKFIIVAAQSNSKANCYIPIKNQTGEIYSNDLGIRELIKTTIVYTQTDSLKNSTRAASWPFSYSTQNSLGDWANDFTTLMTQIITVETELNKINMTEAKALAVKANEAQALAEITSDLCADISRDVERAKQLEQSFLDSPDSNEVSKYETAYKNYFEKISELKNNYTELDNRLNVLSQGIGSLETNQLTIDQKRGLLNLLSMPVNASRLPSFFNESVQLRTTIEGIFSDAKNSDSYASTLASRKNRNEAWKALYGYNESLVKLDKSFTTLENASNAILLEENVNLWVNQDGVEALKINWSSAKNRYSTAEYEKARDFASRAKKNVEQIMAEGVVPAVDNSQDLIVKVIGGLIAAVVIIFVIEKLFLKKKKKPEEYDEAEYN